MIEFDVKIADITVREVFYLIFIAKKDNYSNFFEWFMANHQEDKEISFGNWKPEIL